MPSTDDHYATLGVAPKSEAVDIRAAYLALMRRFHPDRNDTPEAVERAHAINAAFAVLGNVEKRLHYDWARRRAAEEAAEEERRRPALIRKTLIAAVLAVALLLPLSFIAFNGSQRESRTTPLVTKAAANPPSPSPQHAAVADPLVAEPAIVPPAAIAEIEPLPLDPQAPTKMVPVVAEPAPRAVAPSRLVPQRPARQAENVVRPPAPTVTATARCRLASPGAEAAICNNDNLATLDRSVVAFYNQSLRYGAATKRGALLDARIGFLLRREECRSDACLQGVHLAHLREMSSIVEKGQPEQPR